tara:strand:+ start:6453 stop:7928 length:1476 start_codon:yes stop_codon:yes gene_type:complete
MEINLFDKELKEWEGEMLIWCVHNTNLEDQLEAISPKLEPNKILEKFKSQRFKGNKQDYLILNLMGINIETIIFVGVGNLEEIDSETIRNATSLSIRNSKAPSEKIGIFIPPNISEDLELSKVACESIWLSLFKDNRFKKESDEKSFCNTIDLISKIEIDQSSLNEIDAICSGVEFARELVAEPPNSLTPAEMAKRASKIAKDSNISIKILDKKSCEAMGMGAYLAVAKGSDLDPKFIHLTIKPSGEINHKLVMIGKGLTFDSGGYNLKVGAAQIEMMKYDMGGSAAVLGAAKALGKLKPKNIEIHFIIASCENMINGSAVHPGDIVTASNGKTIEINNTDAEGRLTLADAICYANKIRPDAIIDLATLTGACVIALGNEIAGLWSNNKDLSEELQTASKIKGEDLWEMPLKETYKEGLKSSLADLKNTGPRGGGSITAALFLKEFVDKDIPWAHLDIAGTCWTDKAQGINPAGATGFGVRTLVQWVLNKN